MEFGIFHVEWTSNHIVSYHYHQTPNIIRRPWTHHPPLPPAPLEVPAPPPMHHRWGVDLAVFPLFAASNIDVVIAELRIWSRVAIPSDVDSADSEFCTRHGRSDVSNSTHTPPHSSLLYYSFHCYAMYRLEFCCVILSFISNDGYFSTWDYGIGYASMCRWAK